MELFEALTNLISKFSLFFAAPFAIFLLTLFFDFLVYLIRIDGSTSKKKRKEKRRKSRIRPNEYGEYDYDYSNSNYECEGCK